MKLLSTFSPILITLTGLAIAAPSTLSARDPSGDIIVEYAGLGSYMYHFGDCIPLKIDEHSFSSVQVNSRAKCFVYKDNLCQDQAEPVPVIVPPGVSVPNAGDVVNFAGESINCSELE